MFFPLLIVSLISALIGWQRVLRPNDLWWHLAMGRTMVQTHAWAPHFDAFSFTRYGQFYFDQPWLSQILLYGIHRLGGVAGLAFFQGMLPAVTYIPVVLLARRRSAIAQSVVAVLFFGVFLGFSNFGLRPQLLALPVFAWFFYFCSLEVWWPLPLLMLAWANLHGSFILGVWTAFVAMAFSKNRKMAAVAFSTTVVATLCNPAGIKIYSYVSGILLNTSVQKYSTEWEASSIFHSTGLNLWIAVVVALILFYQTRIRLKLRDAIYLGSFFVLAILHQRNVVWLSIIAPPICSEALRFKWPTDPSRILTIKRVEFTAACILIAACLISLPWIKSGPLLDSSTGTNAVEALGKLEVRRLFQSEEVGSYLIWALPQRRVFIDTRVELYPEEQWQDLMLLKSGIQFEALVLKYDFDSFLVNRRTEPKLENVLETYPKWNRVYQDSDYALYRETVAN